MYFLWKKKERASSGGHGGWIKEQWWLNPFDMWICWLTAPCVINPGGSTKVVSVYECVCVQQKTSLNLGRMNIVIVT